MSANQMRLMVLQAQTACELGIAARRMANDGNADEAYAIARMSWKWADWIMQDIERAERAEVQS